MCKKPEKSRTKITYAWGRADRVRDPQHKKVKRQIKSTAFGNKFNIPRGWEKRRGLGMGDEWCLWWCWMATSVECFYTRHKSGCLRYSYVERELMFVLFVCVYVCMCVCA